MGQLIGVTIDKHNISIAHQLPDTKGKKDRFIVKFVRREKQDEFYKSREHPGGKKAASIRGLWDGAKHPPRLCYVPYWILSPVSWWALWKGRQIQEGKQVRIPMDQ